MLKIQTTRKGNKIKHKEQAASLVFKFHALSMGRPTESLSEKSNVIVFCFVLMEVCYILSPRRKMLLQLMIPHFKGKNVIGISQFGLKKWSELVLQ